MSLPPKLPPWLRQGASPLGILSAGELVALRDERGWSLTVTGVRAVDGELPDEGACDGACYQVGKSIYLWDGQQWFWLSNKGKQALYRKLNGRDRKVVAEGNMRRDRGEWQT